MRSYAVSSISCKVIKFEKFNSIPVRVTNKNSQMALIAVWEFFCCKNISLSANTMLALSYILLSDKQHTSFLRSFRKFNARTLIWQHFLMRFITGNKTHLKLPFDKYILTYHICRNIHFKLSKEYDAHVDLIKILPSNSANNILKTVQSY